MTTQVRSQSRGLRMSLLALTASASVVGGMFVSVAPAYSADGIGDRITGVSGQRNRAAALQQINDRGDQTCLRINRVHLDVRHTPIVHETPTGR